MPGPFDAVLVIAFGGPAGPDDVRPFLENVLRGRRVAPARLDEVVSHYARFGGVSPITELTRRQAAGLAARLGKASRLLPVYVGMRNWHPFLADTLAEMSRTGIRRVVALIAAPHRSYSSCAQYRENVRDGRAELRRKGLPDVAVTYVEDWHAHPDYVAACADRVTAALMSLPARLQPSAQLVFTAHSLPVTQTDHYPYRTQFEETSRLVRDAVAAADGTPRSWVCVYQSRSGRPEDPWLGPDVSEYLVHAARRGLEAAVLCPVGFVCDHIEILYDLDVEVAEACSAARLPIARASTVNDHPRFLDMTADLVLRVWKRYERGVPLEVSTRPTHSRADGP